MQHKQADSKTFAAPEPPSRAFEQTATDLQQSEERYQTLFESIGEGFCIVEVLFDAAKAAVDYRFLETNPAFEKQSGIVDAAGKTMREVAPQHEDYWFEIYGKVALTGESARFENYSAALNRWFEVYAFRVGRAADNRVAIIFSDINSRKQAEAALRESEAKYRTVISSLDQAFLILEILFDHNGKAVNFRYLEANPAFEQQSGITNAIGKTAHDLFEHEELWFEIYGKVALTGEAIRFENRSAAINKWFDVYAFRIGAPAERKVALVFNDITQRKQSEAVLRESKARLNTAIAVAQLGTFEWNTITDAVILDARSREIFGFAAAEGTTSEQIFSRIHPSDLERVRSTLR